MADSTSDSIPTTFKQEKTFSSYNRKQGEAYAQARGDYSHDLYQAVMDHHVSTGGKLETLLDIGCGPGTATRGLAPHFLHAIGLDPAEGMISTARSLGGSTAASEPIRFEISTAQELGQHLSPPIAESSVDLITAATAAHWFDMSKFWPRAAHVLKPGGTVALWSTGEVRAHPSMPNAIAIQAAMDTHKEHYLKPFSEPGSLLTLNLYVGLLLPWELPEPVQEFDKASFFRKEWGENDQFIVGDTEGDMDTMEKVWGTASAVTRWRQAHPKDVGTERDVVRVLRREMERLLQEAGVEKGKEKVRGIISGVLLMVKKKTE